MLQHPSIHMFDIRLKPGHCWQHSEDCKAFVFISKMCQRKRWVVRLATNLQHSIGGVQDSCLYYYLPDGGPGGVHCSLTSTLSLFSIFHCRSERTADFNAKSMSMRPFLCSCTLFCIYERCSMFMDAVLCSCTLFYVHACCSMFMHAVLCSTMSLPTRSCQINYC